MGLKNWQQQTHLANQSLVHTPVPMVVLLPSCLSFIKK